MGGNSTGNGGFIPWLSWPRVSVASPHVQGRTSTETLPPLMRSRPLQTQGWHRRADRHRLGALTWRRHIQRGDDIFPRRRSLARQACRTTGRAHGDSLN